MIATERLELLPATIPQLRAAMEDPARLGELLGATVPPSWPPDLLDDGALGWTIDRIRAGSEPEWQMYWVVLRDGDQRTLIGSSGFKGPPNEGTVEVGYGIVADHQRRGYATETVRGLIAFAFSQAEVRRVIAETLPELEPSKGVLAKTGFRFIGDGSEPGVIRYEITLDERFKTASRAAF